MIGLGTLVNAVGVLVGGSIGLLLHAKLPERITQIVFQGIGLFTLFLGVSMALKTENMLILIFSIVIGGIIGELLHLERGINRWADRLKTRFQFGHEKFTEGMITAFLLFCIGSMTVLGAIEEGLGGTPTLLFAKTMLDTFAAMAMAAALGVGVLFSIIPLLIFQGGLTLLAALFGDFMSQSMINELTAVGGLLLLGLGINILEIKAIKVTNMLPALIAVVVLSVVVGLF